MMSTEWLGCVMFMLHAVIKFV